MQNQRIAGESPSDRPSEEHTDSVVLESMLLRESWPWSLDEIARELDAEVQFVGLSRQV